MDETKRIDNNTLYYSNDELDKLNSQFALKEHANSKGMYCRIEDVWVKPLAKWIGDKRVLEVMSGSGHLAKALSDRGVNIKASDDYSWIDRRGWECVYDVERLDCVEAIKKYGNEIDILLISWPYMDNSAYNAIKVLNEVNPKALVIYIGESDGGCTANNNFFDHFYETDDNSFDDAVSSYESWLYIHDRIMLGVYKS